MLMMFMITCEEIMKKLLLASLYYLCFIASPALSDIITNGGFENWANGSPRFWTTVDSGIDINESSNYLVSGSRSIQITVNTRTQSSTDFRQSVDVEAGENYEFSVWIMHSEGGVTARLYIDGYQNYSDPSNTYQWQKLTYNYTANRNGQIEVGLRFYDDTGFDGSESVYVDDFTTISDGGSSGGGTSTGGAAGLNAYYISAEGLSGYRLKTQLHNIIRNHQDQGYRALWQFYNEHELDNDFEVDGSIIDIYSENPQQRDTYTYIPGINQCGNYRKEGDCYNREHSFPQSWFGGNNAPMVSDVHHIFASDGYVNSRRGNYPYGEVEHTRFTSNNGSQLGSSTSNLGYRGTVFEPIDEFKGDIARATLYMAVRYEDTIANWEGITQQSDTILNGSNNQVFEDWYLKLLLKWHQQDPVSEKEKNRNEAAYQYQGNRNPFIDYPEFASQIWNN